MDKKALHRSTLVFRLFNLFTFVYAFLLFNRFSHWAACPVNLVAICQRWFVPVIELETRINAPIEVVFDLSRSIDLHIKSTAQTNERAIAGCTTGLIGPGQEVTWEATHFGVRQTLTTKITQYDRPRHFRDSMVRGAFRRFDHDHLFETEDADTILMKDVFDYNSPFSVLGHIADALFLKRYMTRLLRKRNELIKSVAESEEAELFIKDR